MMVLVVEMLLILPSTTLVLSNSYNVGTGPLWSLLESRPDLSTTHESWPGMALVFLVHWASLASIRPFMYGAAGVFDVLWYCNVSLLLSTIACLASIPALMAATVCSLFVVHLGFTIDVLMYGMKGDVVAGVFGTDLITHQDSNLLDYYTTSHHVWYMPVCLWWLREVDYKWDYDALYMSIIIAVVLLTVTRLLTPKQIEGKLLNINIVYDPPVPGLKKWFENNLKEPWRSIVYVAILIVMMSMVSALTFCCLRYMFLC